MNLKAAWLATATAAAFLLLAACGGDGGESHLDGASDSSQSQAPSGSAAGSGIGPSSSGNGSSSNNCSGSRTNAQYIAIDLHSSGYPGTIGWGIGGGEQVGQGYSFSGNPYVEHAILWRGSASSVMGLHPNGFSDSWAAATDGTTQVGRGGVAGKFFSHALKWSGSADSVVDLDPNGFNSVANGVAGDQIVGSSEDMNSQFHALMWTSRGVVDLTPTGFISAEAGATDGTQQVGAGSTGGESRALLWSGTASSAVDLHPAGSRYYASGASGVGGGQQVGGGLLRSGGLIWSHALLWTGTAESVVDLHPGGFDETYAVAVAVCRQVGWGRNSSGEHALLWNGTADSVVDLHVFLPPGFFQSQAHGIDASGNIIGNADGHAILWVRQ